MVLNLTIKKYKLIIGLLVQSEEEAEEDDEEEELSQHDSFDDRYHILLNNLLMQLSNAAPKNLLHITSSTISSLWLN